MNNENNPEALEREADARRANLSQTLDAVEQRFTPNQWAQQAADYFGEHGGDIASSVSRSVKANPLPLVLTGVGLAWLISSQSRSSASYDDDRGYRERNYRVDQARYRPARGAYTQNALSTAGSSYSVDRSASEYGDYDDDGSMMDSAREAGEKLSRTVSQWRNDLQAKLQSVKQETGESAEQWRERVVNTSMEQADGMDQQYRQLTRSASNWRDDLQMKLKSIKQESGETADQWRERVVSTSTAQAENLEYQYRQAKQQMMARGREHVETTKNWMQDQPLVAGALGVAVGALIGSLLPTSKVEDQYMGDRADAVKSSLAQQAESASDDVASTVADSAETLRAKGEDQLNKAKSADSSTESA